MLRGQKPHPTPIRKLRGNPGKRAYNTREPTPPAWTGAELPPELDGNAVAQREWRRLAPMLHACKILTDADRGVMIAACVEWSRYVEATTQIGTAWVSRRGKLHSWTGIQRHALLLCLRLWTELGCTPSSRTRVHIAESAPIGGDTFTEFDVTDRDMGHAPH